MLRFLAELFLCGVIPDAAHVLTILKNLAKTDRSDDPTCPHLSLIVAFFKYAGEEFLGSVYRVIGAASVAAEPLPAASLVPAASQKLFVTFVDQYVTALCGRLQKRYTAWRAAEKDNLVAKLTKGIVVEARVAQAVEMKEMWETLQKNILTYVSWMCSRLLYVCMYVCILPMFVCMYAFLPALHVSHELFVHAHHHQLPCRRQFG